MENLIEILERIEQKTEDLCATTGSDYFMCPRSLLWIINSVKHDIKNGVPINKWHVCNNEEEFKLRHPGKIEIQLWTSNNCQWNHYHNEGITYPLRYRIN